MATTAGNIGSANIHKNLNRAVELLRELQHNDLSPWTQDQSKLNKLNTLEQVLDCELMQSISRVYEQIYDTVDISGADIKASAASKATVAVFSASLSMSHPRIIELPKTDDSLGFNVISFCKSPIFISRTIPNGVADRHKGLRRGDQLISINGINVQEEHHDRAVELLKAARGKVVLVVKYMGPLLEQYEKECLKREKELNEQRILNNSNNKTKPVS